MRATMGSTIMIQKTVICYLSKRWKKTKKGSPARDLWVQGGQADVGNVLLPITENIWAYSTYHQ